MCYQPVRKQRSPLSISDFCLNIKPTSRGSQLEFHLMKADMNWLTSVGQYPPISHEDPAYHLDRVKRCKTSLHMTSDIFHWPVPKFPYLGRHIRYEFPSKGYVQSGYVPFLRSLGCSGCGCTVPSLIPDVSGPFIAYYTIVPCSSFSLILKCFNTKDMIKYKVLKALSTEVKLSTG